MIEKHALNWKVVGKAGEGIAVTGKMFASVCVRHGMQAFLYGEAPSLIRGGHNTAQVSAAFAPVSCQRRMLDMLVAFDASSLSLHKEECTPETLILTDVDQPVP